MDKIDLKPFLGQNAHWQVNKKIAKMVGIEAALLLSYLIDKDGFFSSSYGCVGDDEYFCWYSESIEAATPLSYKVQQRCIAELENSGFIKTKLMGIPRKLYFALCKLHIFQKVTYINAETATIEMPKGQLIYKESNNKESILKNNNKIDLQSKQKSFKNFTLEDFKNEMLKYRTEAAAHLTDTDLWKFYNYWTETSISGKMRFAMEKTWNTDKRLARWKSDDKGQINGQKNNGKPTGQDVMKAGQSLLLRYAEMEKQKMGKNE